MVYCSSARLVCLDLSSKHAPANSFPCFWWLVVSRKKFYILFTTSYLEVPGMINLRSRIIGRERWLGITEIHAYIKCPNTIVVETPVGSMQTTSLCTIVFTLRLGVQFLLQDFSHLSHFFRGVIATINFSQKVFD